MKIEQKDVEFVKQHNFSKALSDLIVSIAEKGFNDKEIQQYILPQINDMIIVCVKPK